MPRRLVRSRLRALGVAVALLVSGACEPGDGAQVAAASGRYVGSPVSFRIAGETLTDFRLSGIECRIPHPLNEAVALCLVRAPGVPEGALALSGGSFSGALGDVALDGVVDGTTASGTWRFETACPGGEACVAEGEWEADFVADATPPDGGDASTGGDLPVGVDGAADPGPLGGGDQGPGPAPDVVVPEPTVPTGASDEQIEAARALAAIRAAVGLPMPEQIAGINAAAQAHAEYYVAHVAQYSAAHLSPHEENPAWPEGYTGASAGDRLVAQGVTPGFWSEVMAFTGSAEASLDGWMETLYHREPLVHPNMVRWGFGIARAGQARAEVIDSINGQVSATGSGADLGPALWPVRGATEVPTRWDGLETPKPPLPAGQSYPSGPIVTATFERSHALSLAEGSLRDPAGETVPAQVQSPDNDPYLTSTWAIYAYAPLAARTRYTVTFHGQVDGADTLLTWEFTTR
ncbi:MAG: hypothetical protein H6744_03990 [Deltaproteobacteria bacterium]|nr:hypothetical protein [Deltaproteobacteria bacterium]